jgi:hypothetical protein
MSRAPDPFTPRAVPKKPVAYDFVLDELSELALSTRPMFGSTAVYVEDRIVFILRKKGDPDDGVWVVLDRERAAEVLELLPRLRVIDVLGGRAGGWRKLAADSPSFEDDVLSACRLVKRGDPRIGKIPERQQRKNKQANKQPLATKRAPARPKATPAAKPARAGGTKSSPRKSAAKPRSVRK